MNCPFCHKETEEDKDLQQTNLRFVTFWKCPHCPHDVRIRAYRDNPWMYTVEIYFQHKDQHYLYMEVHQQSYTEFLFYLTNEYKQRIVPPLFNLPKNPFVTPNNVVDKLVTYMTFS